MSFKYILIASIAFSCVFARPSDSPPEKQQPTVIPIVAQSEEIESNGTYKFSYETGNGIKREEIAFEKVLPKGREASTKEDGENDDESDEIHVQQGSYSYTAPDGTIITLRYIADENGFQPIGDHLPKAPELLTASLNAAEKSGRNLKAADSTDSASSIVEAKSAKKPSEPVAVSDDLLKTVPVTQESKPSSTDAAKPETKSEGNSPVPAKINVSTEVASTTVPAQISTESEQASPASEKETSAAEKSSEVTESSSSTSAPEQSSSSEVVGQPITTEAASQSPAEEAQKQSVSTAQPAAGEESGSTTITA